MGDSSGGWGGSPQTPQNSNRNQLLNGVAPDERSSLFAGEDPRTPRLSAAKSDERQVRLLQPKQGMHLKCGTSLEAARPAAKPDAEFLLDMLYYVELRTGPPAA